MELFILVALAAISFLLRKKKPQEQKKEDPLEYFEVLEEKPAPVAEKIAPPEKIEEQPILEECLEKEGSFFRNPKSMRDLMIISEILHPKYKD